MKNPVPQVPDFNPLTLARMTGLITSHNFKLQETPSLSGKVAVLTGGQAGIGKEITAQLLLHGIGKVFVLARTQSKFDSALVEWANKPGLSKDDVEARTEFVKCDLSDILAVKKAADYLAGNLDRIDMLLNNGGIANAPGYKLSPQGIENIFATNHVGHYVLTLLLQPLIVKTASTHGDARVVITSSSLHMIVQELDLNQLTSPNPTKSPASFDATWRYGRSKLANILFAQEFAARLDNMGYSKVYANSFFPGNIPTEAMDTWKENFGSLVGSMFKGTFQVIGQSPEEGAATAIFLASSSQVENQDLKGKYFVPVATEAKTSTLAQDKDLQKNLWYWTDHIVSQTLGKDWQPAS